MILIGLLVKIVVHQLKVRVVLVSGHLDSWDVGQGAMDDGGGAFISWEALSLIKDLGIIALLGQLYCSGLSMTEGEESKGSSSEDTGLSSQKALGSFYTLIYLLPSVQIVPPDVSRGLRPKRTLRLVLWTAEEQGGIGAFQYYQLHKANISNYSLVMESDLGTFLPSGLQFTGSEKARAIVEEVMSLLQPINITQVFRAGEGTDINFWIEAGVPDKEAFPLATVEWRIYGCLRINSITFCPPGAGVQPPLSWLPYGFASFSRSCKARSLKSWCTLCSRLPRHRPARFCLQQRPVPPHPWFSSLLLSHKPSLIASGL
ncbi:hypothetical protein CB1_001652019, partial [Camelus ferus]